MLEIKKEIIFFALAGATLVYLTNPFSIYSCIGGISLGVALGLSNVYNEKVEIIKMNKHKLLDKETKEHKI